MSEENYKHINEWATNKKVFELQLQSNESEFYNGFPHHWNCYINFLKTLNLETFKILDVGCGCGFFKKLTEKYYPKGEYFGLDYSKYAIDLCKKQWNSENFICENYTDLNKSHSEKYDVILASSLTNVMSNGDETLDKLLSIGAKYYILLKILTTEKPSHYTIYKAYDLIDTYRYEHNYENLKSIFQKYGYKSVRDETKNNFLLKKQN
jgi:SAM-dependent methyltransferase